MPKQGSFMLVPNPVVGFQGLVSRAADSPQSKPPMTSKQAQKLHKLATRQPRLSKAEQRRFERDEQERIRNEFDKEKQASKARVARDKKKAKEQQAVEHKRKNGLPLVDVRPSQDTIARFVRGNGLGRKRDSLGADVRLETVTEEAEIETEPLLPARKKSASPPIARATAISTEPAPPAPAGYKTPLPATARATVNATEPVPPAPAGYKLPPPAAARVSVNSTAAWTASATPRSISTSTTTAAATAATTPTSTTADTCRIVRQELGKARSKKADPVTPQPPVFRKPPIPVPRAVDARPATRQRTRYQNREWEMAPPTSTQLFVMEHIDDLFPTPSQGARELQEESPRTPAPLPKAVKPQPPGQGWGHSTRGMQVAGSPGEKADPEPVLSQETDYGDFDLDDTDLKLLEDLSAHFGDDKYP